MTAKKIISAQELRRALLAGEALEPNLHVSGDADFSGCTGLTALPEGITFGGDAYFSGCTGLTALPEIFTMHGKVITREEIPVIEDLDSKIYTTVSAGTGPRLKMSCWHEEGCNTTHCRAGWAIHLGGEKGYALERAVGPAMAGALIYVASGAPVPNFYDTDEGALADLRARASA